MTLVPKSMTQSPVILLIHIMCLGPILLRKMLTTNAKNAHHKTAPMMTPESKKTVSKGGVSLLIAPEAVKRPPKTMIVSGLEIVKPKLAAKSPRILRLEFASLFLALFSFHC